MTKKEQVQVLNSLLAIAGCILFLWTGKKFIWNQAVATDPNADSSTSVSDPITAENTTSAPVSTTTTARTAPEPQTDTTAAASFQSDTTDAAQITAPTDCTTDTTATSTTTTTATAAETVQPSGSFVQAPEGYFNDVLFVGDSRTVGMANYAPIDGATYFATTGLAAHKVYSVTSEVESTFGQTFSQVIASRKFGKIYVMLGINEIGNNRTVTLQNYHELLKNIRAAQPDAILVIQANLHVAQSRSLTDPVVNNTQINSFNAAIAQFADGVKSFYLDVNPVFDDADGALGAQYTHDGTHPLAKYYKDWDNFLMSHAVIV